MDYETEWEWEWEWKVKLDRVEIYVLLLRGGVPKRTYAVSYHNVHIVSYRIASNGKILEAVLGDQIGSRDGFFGLILPLFIG
jgi:hypothetical protein